MLLLVMMPSTSSGQLISNFLSLFESVSSFDGSISWLEPCSELLPVSALEDDLKNLHYDFKSYYRWW